MQLNRTLTCLHTLAAQGRIHMQHQASRPHTLAAYSLIHWQLKASYS